MFKMFKELYGLLDETQKRRFIVLQLLIIVMSMLEVVAIFSIVPFMGSVGNMQLLDDENIVAAIYSLSGFESPKMFLVALGVGVLFALLVSSTVSMFTTWRLYRFSADLGVEFADALFKYYLKQNWLFHTVNTSSYLVKQISTESMRVSDNIIVPLMFMNAKIIFSLFVSVSVFLYDPFVAISGVLIFALSYVFIYKVVKNRLQAYGQGSSKYISSRFSIMGNAFGGVKDVLLLGKSKKFCDEFKKLGELYAHARGSTMAISTVPRNLMEFVAFGSMIALVIYLMFDSSNSLSSVLPALSVYAMAGFKLLPAFQQIYSSVSTIKGNSAAFDAIKGELKNIRHIDDKTSDDSLHLELNESMVLSDIVFTYPQKDNPAINHLSLKIKANSTVGFVGASGGGKNTIVDILLGLIAPQSGSLSIDEVVIDSSNVKAWQKSVGYVPQAIFLSDGSIAQNVAFGLNDDEIDYAQVEEVLKLAHLNGLVSDLPDGVHTHVGERGVQLSGGQRQRIGIARALYHNPSVLIFDEATSALDGITEKIIMDAIGDFGGKKTIVMIAHRLKTVQKCDNIFFITNGQVSDSGTYNELLEKNEQFDKMARHS